MLLTVLATACKEEDNRVGGTLRPSDVIRTDTIDAIQAFSIAEDSIRTSKMSAEVFGWVEDPVFGNVRSHLYIQFRLSANAVNFGEGAELDSVVLSIPYAGFFGDTSNKLQVGVYELDESMYKDSVYYSKRHLAVRPVPLAMSGQVEIHPLQKVVVMGEEQSPQLRIVLDKDYFTQKLLQKSGAPELADNAHFLPYFKGLMLKAEGKESKGCLAYLDVLNGLTAVTLHYHNQAHDSLTFQLISNDSSVYFAYIDHQGYAEAETELKRQVVDKQYGAASRLLYVQASGGVKVQLRFPGLKSCYADKKVVVHKAELVMSPDYSVEGGYNPWFHPSSLSMYYKQDSASSKTYFLPDYLNLGSDFFGGKFQEEDSTYRFLLTEYLQYLLMGKIDEAYPLYLIANGAAIQATRVRLLGPAHPNRSRRMRLIITYSLADMLQQ
ncbi:MAG: DUF4270 domain-containing protein [Bacteroidales bacterium]|nr:DUF4270 domain-containing protein [Bacteroidales bacterium]